MSKESDILEHAAQNGFNVLLTGKHGVGKTAIVRECFDKLKWNWKYFSASTIDPWVDLVGIPHKGADGQMELLRPANLDFDNIEAIFLDEYNRAPKKVRNAVMELIQFKSINGKKFPKLKVVFAAINPDDDEDLSYDVETLDPAQIDRFELLLPVKSEPNAYFFKNVYGSTGSLAVKWWLEQTKEVKDLISPRRLEAGVKVFLAKGDPQFVFDAEKVNVGEFSQYLDMPDPIEQLDAMVNATEKEKIAFLKDSNTYKHLQSDLLGKTRYLSAFAHCIPEQEQMKQLRSSKGTKFITHVISNVADFENLVDTVLRNNKRGTYSARIVDAFTVYRKTNGASSSVSTAGREVMVNGQSTLVSSMVICFSGGLAGYNRSEAHELMEAYGAECVDSMSFRVTHLVTNQSLTAKAKQAASQGTSIVSESDFYKMVSELNSPSVSKNPNPIMRTINGMSVDVNKLTLDNYLDRTGQQFRMEKWDVENNISREASFLNRMERFRAEAVK